MIPFRTLRTSYGEMDRESSVIVNEYCTVGVIQDNHSVVNIIGNDLRSLRAGSVAVKGLSGSSLFAGTVLENSQGCRCAVTIGMAIGLRHRFLSPWDW